MYGTWNGDIKFLDKEIIKTNDDIVIEKIISLKKVKSIKTKYHNEIKNNYPNEVRTYYPHEFESDDFYC